jgi:preprotein translocase subunit SecE
MKVEIYKKGQGKYTRLGTLIGVSVIALAGAKKLSDVLASQDPYVQYGVPALVVLVLGLFTAWLINRPGPADFLIATEGEMKKVSWSNRKEVTGSTKIVIVTTAILASILFAVDVLLILFFTWIGLTA